MAVHGIINKGDPKHLLTGMILQVHLMFTKEKLHDIPGPSRSGASSVTWYQFAIHSSLIGIP